MREGHPQHRLHGRSEKGRRPAGRLTTAPQAQASPLLNSRPSLQVSRGPAHGKDLIPGPWLRPKCVRGGGAPPIGAGCTSKGAEQPPWPAFRRALRAWGSVWMFLMRPLNPWLGAER